MYNLIEIMYIVSLNGNFYMLIRVTFDYVFNTLLYVFASTIMCELSIKAFPRLVFACFIQLSIRVKAYN